MLLLTITLIFTTVLSIIEWTEVLSKGALSPLPNGAIFDVGEAEFNRIFQESECFMIRRECSDCEVDSHKDVIYKRHTNIRTFSPYSYMSDNWFSANNILNHDFGIFETFADAVAETNGWEFCNYDDGGVGFPRDCGPTGSVILEWNEFYSGRVGGRNDIRFSIFTGTKDECPTVNPTLSPTESPTRFCEWIDIHTEEVGYLGDTQTRTLDFPAPEPEDIEFYRLVYTEENYFVTFSTVNNNDRIFGDDGTINQNIPIFIHDTSAFFITPGAGNEFCKAASVTWPDRYGTSSWAIKSDRDLDRSCGCTSPFSGVGIHYGGWPEGECNVDSSLCPCLGGGLGPESRGRTPPGGLPSVGFTFSVCAVPTVVETTTTTTTTTTSTTTTTLEPTANPTTFCEGVEAECIDRRRCYEKYGRRLRRGDRHSSDRDSSRRSNKLKKCLKKCAKKRRKCERRNGSSKGKGSKGSSSSGGSSSSSSSSGGKHRASSANSSSNSKNITYIVLPIVAVFIIAASIGYYCFRRRIKKQTNYHMKNIQATMENNVTEGETNETTVNETNDKIETDQTTQIEMEKIDETTN